MLIVIKKKEKNGEVAQIIGISIHFNGERRFEIQMFCVINVITEPIKVVHIIEQLNYS